MNLRDFVKTQKNNKTTFVEVFECSVHVLGCTVVPAQAAKGHRALPHTPQ